MMLGLIVPTAGTVRLFGRDPMVSVHALDGVAGFVEAPRFYPYLTGRRNLEMLAAFDGGDGGGADRRRPGDGRADRPGRRPRGRLLARDAPAPGDRRRAAARPRLLLLDEPATGLDPAGMRDMRRLIRRLADEGMTVLLSSHLLAEVEELCNRVAIVRSGAHRLRGPHRRAQAHRRLGLPAADHRRRPRAEGLPRPARDRRRRAWRRARSTSPPTRPPCRGLSVALVEAGALIRALAPQTVTLEDLFFSLTEDDAAGDGAAAPLALSRAEEAA